MGLTVDLRDPSFGDVVRLGSSLRRLTPVTTVEEFADRLCQLLIESFVDEAGDRQVVLGRLYLTQPFADLPPAEQAFVGLDQAGTGARPRSLVLLGTAGELPEWNDRRKSSGHLCIPLHSAASVAGMPMVSALLRQMGIDVPSLVEPAGLVMNADEHRFGVFHAPEAEGSPFIPAQDFVQDHAVASVVGFGGALPDGEMHAIVLFTKASVSAQTATLLETLSPSITLALTELAHLPTFTDAPRSSPCAAADLLASSREGLLRGLLEVHERVAAEEADLTRAALARATREAERYAALARTLQASLLPLELPKISGLKSAAFFHPAGDGSEIGGDFYDLFPIRRGTWGMVLGDVSGKGATAASLTALARHTVRAAALRATSSTEVLHLLNEAAYRQQIAEGHYLTALFATVSRRGAMVEVDLCLGGHEGPLLLRPGLPATEVGSIGQPLGLFPRAELVQTRFALERGDSLITFTDGVTDARRGKDHYGTDRVGAMLSALSDRPVAEIVSALATAVQQFQGPRAYDDIAILGIQASR